MDNILYYQGLKCQISNTLPFPEVITGKDINCIKYGDTLLMSKELYVRLNICEDIKK